MGEEIEDIRKRKMKEMMDKMKYPDRPIEIKDGNFNETVKKYPVVLVDFWSERCPPCRLIAPVIEELAGELKGEVVFGKLDVDQNRATAVRFSIMAIPTLMIFKKGELVDQIMGAVPKEYLLEQLKKHLD
jgi:thioredoxin 1